ncbi:MAG: deoxyribonuclease IV [Phycisphaerales bacterium]|nr:MAG: deoxyribonuclease IV [Phycisphaerales bacterium]
MSRPLPLFGAHLSIAGGLQNALYAGRDIGCDCVQLFVKNQRQWNAASLLPGQIEAFRAAQRETGLMPLLAHAGYLLNLASPVAQMRRRSKTALLDELRRCEALGIDGLIFHPGSAKGDSEQVALRRVATGLNEILRKTEGFRTRLLIENTAGQGANIGHRFEQIATIIDRVEQPERVGVCLDTCHLFVAGYDFRTAEGYRGVMEELDTVMNVALIKCVHVNDSKGRLGSRLDRHEHIGKGQIKKSGFAHFVNDPHFARIPMILETPKGKDGRGVDYDKLNLKRLRSLIRR